ncbi:hypothetical protein PAECIP111892_00485 [Paenibacillus auburnensis]|uniref:Uncharacterized protein n=1 Tax=Paenibacillus auburnensis TaxID=2905649 RepID=A0ABM9BQ00_9BACL|nr:hypothetical protein PAECIP111892_00485 [Paenibacillus auburnensis]
MSGVTVYHVDAFSREAGMGISIYTFLSCMVANVAG